MFTLLNWWSQVAAITGFSLRTLPQRKGSAAATIFGIGGVVAVLVGTLSIAQGFRRALVVSGSPDNVLVLRSGADTEMTSFLMQEETRIVADAPQVAHADDGPLVSCELYVIIDRPKRFKHTDANVPLRGVGPAAFAVRDDLRLIAGRRFVNGCNEVIVGRGAAAEFDGLEVGTHIQVGLNEWQVVGVFSANGGVAESEIWTDTAVLQAAYRRGTSFQSVLVKLKSPDAFEAFQQTLAADPRVNLKAIRQTDYYAEQSNLIYNLVTILGSLVASLMGIGAVFGALNTMYSAVAARTREIATLRALGFGNAPVILSVLLESLILALLGGITGGTLAWWAFDGFQAATLNWQSFSQVAFAFAVTPALLVKGIIYAALIGLVGGLFPALRAARLPISAALREL